MEAVVERSVWHEGERALQARFGVRERMEAFGPKVVRDHMPEQHRDFFAQLPFIVAGSLDADDQPWASVLAAPAGFMHSPDPTHLRIDAWPAADDPLARQLVDGAPIGLLGIEPQTRRRNRMNGELQAVGRGGFTVEVRESFGNCPKYIQARQPVFMGAAGSRPVAQWSDRLDEPARRLIAAADTFFIASAYPGSGPDDPARAIDVSHRGGSPGFVRLGDDGTMWAPDFVGNSFFNTLGNLAVHPKAGLLFIDFSNGDLLQIAVDAEVLVEGPQVAAFEGAQRMLRMRVRSVLRRPAALPLRWSDAEPSPHIGADWRWLPV
jgi:uncharacterized protein